MKNAFYMTVVDANIYVKIDGHMDPRNVTQHIQKVKNTMIATIVCTCIETQQFSDLHLRCPLRHCITSVS